MSEWDSLSEKTQNVYSLLGTRDESEIKSIKTRHLVTAIRESKMVGYDDFGTYEWLLFEYDKRKERRNHIVAIIVMVSTVIIAVMTVVGFDWGSIIHSG